MLADMRVRVYDSDGVFRGGLFRVSAYDPLRFRRWHAPPHPHYSEMLIDIAGMDEPSYEGSWFRVYISKNPEVEGEGSDSFDASSFANSFSCAEARDWLHRYGYAVPEDLQRLCESGGGTPANNSPAPSDPWAPYMPARWFKEKYGISPERLRAALRASQLRAGKQRNRNLYSVPEAAKLWPEDNIEMPAHARPPG